MMTAYVTLKAVKDGKHHARHAADGVADAASQSPSKMGFRPGTQVTVDNALKMMMVKSANDMAVVLAEGVGGSIDGFSAMMNETAQKLGMTQTSYVNPNGLPADGQITSARDLGDPRPRDHPRPAGIRIFRAHPGDPLRPRVTRQFQQADRPLSRRRRLQDRLHLRLRLQSRGLRHAQRQPADRRRARRLLRHGARGARRRSCSSAASASNRLSWLRPSLGTVENLVPIDASPPNLREEMCGGKRKRPASDEDERLIATNGGGERLASGGEAAGDVLHRRACSRRC